jgi:subfamily B ATP-binding cassette protein MsbA/ATP-binding cassette subfamily B protein AbcA/BmrA
MLKDAPVLLLDEPTAALDSESEAQVLRAIENLMEDRTTLIVSHRLSTLRGADCICVLDRGRVCERGHHEDLLQLDGLYRRLYEQQTIVEDPMTAGSGAKP